jgi:uncharacterized protein YjdB
LGQLGRTQNLSFTNKGKAGESFSNSMNVLYNGQATITVPGLDSKTSLTLSIRNPGGTEVFKETFNSGTSKNVILTAGNHTLTTKIDSANGNVSARVDIVVVESSASQPVLPSSITVSPASAALDVNLTRQLEATVAPANATDKTITWTSSNAAVATVSGNGLVTAKAPGTAIITAKTSNNLTSACTITVNAGPPLPPALGAVTLLTINNASYGNKDTAKSHEVQVTAAGNLTVSLNSSKNDSYIITLKRGGETLATAISTNGSATINYIASIADKYVITVEKTSNGNANYSLSATWLAAALPASQALSAPQIEDGDLVDD